jgi:predicted RNA-binding protein associated with RNAse of E/G family
LGSQFSVKYEYNEIYIIWGGVLERRKYLGQYDKDFIKSIRSKIVRTNEVGLTGYVALIQIDEVHYPGIVGDKGSEVCIADNGYSELSFLPDNENWYLTAIYDNNNDIIEWYFDITRRNSIDENGNPYCDDLYLDCALLPDGQILTFDEDQIKDALINNQITQKDFDMAYDVLNELKDQGILEVSYMENFCTKIKSKLMI